MKQENHPKEARTNGLGANYDIDNELSGSSNNGEYFDGHNGRVSSSRGNKGAFEKIRGEEVAHDRNDDIIGDYFCIGNISVKDQKVEFWVDETNSQDPIIRVDGVIVGSSDKMPWLREFPLQMDKNESCVGGEVFLTDFNTPPMILNVKDMVDSLTADPTKYFADFNPDLYTINLNSPIDIPVFTELVNLGGGGGLPVGEYQYSIRYVNEDGDRTNWGPLTPPIPVLQSISSLSNHYPYTKTFGGAANVTAPTAYGIKLKFRVTNLVNYDFIEIRRISYNAEQGIDVIPGGVIVAKIDISAGEISIKEFIDPAEANVEEVLADNEETNQLSFINKAKAIRYHDKKLVLMNYQTADKDSDGVSFLDINGKGHVPIVQALGKAGHNDPVNHAYYRNYPSGERFSFAANLFDGLGGRGFAISDPSMENIEIPNRRDEADSDSQDLSYFGMATAANTNGAVTKTFEVFDHENAIRKDDKCSFKNILSAGSKSSGTVNDLGCPDSGNGSIVQGDEIGYEPYRSTDQNDNPSSHGYRSVVEADYGSGTREYEPKGFGLNYYSKGIAFGGLDNLPNWAKAFSIVRTRPADRIVAQGIGMYSMTQGDFDLLGNSSAATKDRRKLWFHSPDIYSGLVNQSVLDDINTNPQNYKIQVVSPLGFFSEVYGFEQNTVNSARDRLVDMITYARVLHDEGDINPGEDAVMGAGAGGKRWVAYNRYRNTSDNVLGGAFNTPDGGNTLIGVQGFNTINEGRGVYHEIELNQNIYNNDSSGGTGSNDFDDQGLKDFTEPFYMVNIIRDGATVVDQNIDQYIGTGHWQKIESIIGEGNGQPNQEFPLVDERWEDCIPDLSSTGSMATDEVFVCIEDQAANRRTYMDATFLSPAQQLAIMNDITNNGFYLASTGDEVVGLYTHTNTNNKEFSIVFNISSFFPLQGERVYVKYDNRRPIRVFGGNTTVGESIFSPIDREAEGDTNERDSQFTMNIGFPFRKYRMNPRHYVVRKTTGANKIQNSETAALGYIRQLCVMYTCESKISNHFAYNSNYPDQVFPLTHYVMRPNRWDDSSFGSNDPIAIKDDNNLYEEYFEDYPEEWNNWNFGGFRFLPNHNIDYSMNGPIEYFSKPDFGFEIENDFCTGVAWSLPRAINQQDSPGLKTFLSLNRINIADDNGAIKKAYDARTGGKGENLYAICESGICLLLTKKSILSNISGDDLSQTATDDFISNEYWLSHDVGSNDEMWRGMAEQAIEIQAEGKKIKVDALFIPNKDSVFRLLENRVEEIAEGSNYYARIHPVLSRVRSGYQDHVAGVIDEDHNEYWLQLNTRPIVDFTPCIGLHPEERRTFVFANDTNHWIGTFDYNFDKYIFNNGKVYGTRDLQTYELDKGFIINNLPITCSLTQNFSPNQAIEKEFIRIQVNTGPRGTMKPSRIEFYDENGQMLCAMDEALYGPLYLKQYDGWEQFIPRKDVSASQTRDRLQHRLLVCKIIHNFEEDFKIVDSVVQYKLIK